VEHLRRTVRFASGLDCLKAGETTHLVEVGPGRTLGTLARQGRGAMHVVSSLPGPDAPASPDVWVLDALGQMWQAGVEVDWSAVHGGRRRLRLPMPTYPFERSRYWIDVPPADDEHPAKTAARKMPDPVDWQYAPRWEQSLPVECLESGRVDPAGTEWLVLADEGPLSAGLVARLKRAAPGHVTVATAGTSFAAPEPDRYVIDVRSAADYVRLTSALEAAGRYPDVVVHLWSLAPEPEATAAADVIASQERGLFSLMHLARALAPDRAVSVRVVTTGGQDVTGGERLVPGHSTILAAARVLPQEQPQVVMACVDVAVEELTSEGRVDQLSARLAAELLCVTPEPFVAYRGGSRWVQTFVPVPLPQMRAAGGWRQGGAYLILGGLGRIGLSLAIHLAETAQARLVLVGRSDMPLPARWDEWLASHADADRVSQRIKAIRHIESLGGDVQVVVADVADAADLERAFREGEQAFGPMDGVIAAAGIIDATAFAPLATLGVDECVRQFRPKVDGLFALDAALSRRRIPLCLLVSSLSSVLGGLGYGAYGAANIFMDTFARLRNRDGRTHWLSVNWDAWSWARVGEDVPGAALARLAMTPREACDVFDRLPSAVMMSLPQVVVSTSQLTARLTLWVDRVGARAVDAPAPPVRMESSPAEAVVLATVAEVVQAPTTAAVAAVASPGLTPSQQAIIDVWRAVLGIRHVELHDSFLDLGGNSLTAVQVISRLEQTLNVRIAIEEFIFQTAGQLATLCDQKRAAAASPGPALSPGDVVVAGPSDSPSPTEGGSLLRSLRSVLTGGRT
jgi:acyl transferase domain-containing protein/acyl carrier protein